MVNATDTATSTATGITTAGATASRTAGRHGQRHDHGYSYGHGQLHVRLHGQRSTARGAPGSGAPTRSTRLWPVAALRHSSRGARYVGSRHASQSPLVLAPN